MEFINSMQGNIVITMMTIFLIICLIGTIVMALLLLLKGDERKKMLLLKSAMVTLIGSIAVLVLGFIYTTFIVPQCNFEVELSPIMYLGVMSLIFDIAYLVYSKKYGD